MKTPQISEDVLPIAKFKTHASEVLKKLQDTQRPIVITQNGKPTAVIITPEEFDRLYEREQFIRAVNNGLADVEAGRVIDDDELSRVLDEESDSFSQK